MSEPASGFLRTLARLSDAGVAYVIVGVGGTSFHARITQAYYAELASDSVEFRLADVNVHVGALEQLLRS